MIKAKRLKRAIAHYIIFKLFEFIDIEKKAGKIEVSQKNVVDLI
jgi:hypothetical protein